MTAATFRARLEALGWTQRGLAALLGVKHNTVHRWAADQARIPDDIATWLDTVAQAVQRVMQTHPPPW